MSTATFIQYPRDLNKRLSRSNLADVLEATVEHIRIMELMEAYGPEYTDTPTFDGFGYLFVPSRLGPQTLKLLAFPAGRDSLSDRCSTAEIIDSD